MTLTLSPNLFDDPSIQTTRFRAFKLCPHGIHRSSDPVLEFVSTSGSVKSVLRVTSSTIDDLAADRRIWEVIVILTSTNLSSRFIRFMNLVSAITLRQGEAGGGRTDHGESENVCAVSEMTYVINTKCHCFPRVDHPVNVLMWRTWVDKQSRCR